MHYQNNAISINFFCRHLLITIVIGTKSANLLILG